MVRMAALLSLVIVGVGTHLLLWESTLTEEQKEELAAGTLAIANVSAVSPDFDVFRQ